MKQFRAHIPRWVEIGAKCGESVDLATEQGRVDGFIARIKELEKQHGENQATGQR